jgi:hypothetical protein
MPGLGAMKIVGAWGIVACGVMGCGGKDHPAQVPDDMHGTTTTSGTTTGGGMDSGPDVEIDAGPTLGNPALFEKCYQDVREQQGIVADPWFCFATTTGNPAENSVVRNLLYPKFNFHFTLDDAHRVFAVDITYWFFGATAPEGQALTPGMLYSTANNDGTAIHFYWDKGDCGTDPENGAFIVRDLTYDATNKVLTCAFDWEHRCGDKPPLYGRVRLHNNAPP